MMLLYLLLGFSLFVIFALFLYPVFSLLRSRIYKRPVLKSDAFIQPVSIIIACYNEEAVIAQKIDSFLAESEWIEGSEIIVVSDGSNDGTNDILRSYSRLPYVRAIFQNERIFKINAVNLAMTQVKNEIIIFSDCRQVMKPGSVRSLVNNFNDPEVGTVTSTLVSASDRRYSVRRLLNFVAHCDSTSGSSLNVFGALYAQRKSVFRKIPPDLLFDDLFVTVSTLAQGKRLVTDKNVILYDVPFHEYYLQNRIERLTRGLLIFLSNHYRLIWSLPPGTFMRFIIFKYFKLALPLCLLLASCILTFLIYPYSRFVGSLFLSFVAVLAVAPVRRLFVQFLKINFFMTLATSRFLFFKQRSNKWDKLELRQPEIIAAKK